MIYEGEANDPRYACPIIDRLIERHPESQRALEAVREIATKLRYLLISTREQLDKGPGRCLDLDMNMHLDLQSPSAGRIVRYMAPDGKIWPAVIVAVTDHDLFEARLMVMEWDKLNWLTAPYSGPLKVGYWSWPTASAAAGTFPAPGKREGKEL